MQDSEKQKFEEKWKKAFDGAEMTPPDRVWSSIELDLAGQESATMKKRVVFYQRLAAATVLFALLSGVYAFYVNSNAEKLMVKQEVRSEESGVRSQDSGARSQEAVKSNEQIAANKGNTSAETSNSKPVTRNSQPESRNSQPVTQNSQLATLVLHDTPILAEEIPQENITEESIARENITPENISEESVAETKTEEPAVAVVSPLVQQTEQPEEVVQPKRKASRESNLWLALGASAGNYSPNTPSATTTSTQSSFAPTLDALNAAQQAHPKVGSSYSFGMAVGKKFGRIVVQTGVNLNKQQVEYTSNYDTRPVQSVNSSAKAASSEYLMAANTSGQMNFTNAYTVNSAMEIVSIPVQAGYMIIDRKLGWQVNAGVSPDFFIRNILVDESGQRERFTQSAGSASPYRSVNWSGLLNTELSYRIGTHYRVSLVPGVRYSFNPLLKESADSGRPMILDVGFRFRYLFE